MVIRKCSLAAEQTDCSPGFDLAVVVRDDESMAEGYCVMHECLLYCI